MNLNNKKEISIKYDHYVSLLKRIGLLILISIVLINSAFSIGTGGILNLVPQARVWKIKDEIKEQLYGWKVYVHPFEGALLLVPPDEDTCIALDKHMKRTLQIEARRIKFLNNDNMVEVKEDTPYKVLKNAPHFNRIYAEITLEDGTLLKVDVER